MNKKELLSRYLVFGISLLIISFGISIITRSNLGTSPISSIPYVGSLNTPLTMGTYFFIFTIILIIAQMLLLGRQGIREKKMELVMQFPVAFFLSVFTDLTMWLLSDFNPELYYVRILALVIGCLILAFGICVEVIADVTMISAEYTIQFASKRFKKEFGMVKVCFDVTLVVLAALLSLTLSGRIEGVREGTVIAALITGPFVRVIMPRLSPLRKWLAGMADVQVPPQTQTAENGAVPLVITVSREYGSGGHRVGELLAKQLGVPFYDKELIGMVAAESDFSEKFISDNEQRMPSPLLYQMIFQDYEAPLDKSLSYEDALFVAQSKVIRRIAQQGPCVIVGRCADYILRDRPNTVNVFLHADIRHKTERAVAEYGIDRDKAQETIESTNKSRKEHYYHYTGQRWGDSRNYDITLDTSNIPAETVAGIILELQGKRLFLRQNTAI